jgi:lactate dehydrogenase-like 2-hydroxyacid dehydrogenase
VQLTRNEPELMRAGISASRLEGARVDLQHRIAAALNGKLSFGAFTARKPANSRALVVGAGPVGASIAMRLTQSGVSNVALKARLPLLLLSAFSPLRA